MSSLRRTKSIDGWLTGSLFRLKGPTFSLPPSPSGLESQPLLCIVCHLLLTLPEFQARACEGSNSKHPYKMHGCMLHQPSFHDLCYSAAQQCYICLITLNRILAGRSLQEAGPEYDRAEFETSWEFLGRDGELLHVYLADNLTYFTHRPTVTFRLIPRPGTTRYDLLSPTLDQSIKSLINGWLTSCQKNHSCHRSADRWMPTRLLSVQQNGSDVKLVVFDNDSPARPYATLSHVWGLQKHTMLETGNIETFRSSIPKDALPKCFQQAVFVARLLGIEYLWIDSLCILQNSTEDWSREAVLMASVYGNSTVNIAMSSASESSQGCFRARNLDRLRLPIVSYVRSYRPADDGPTGDSGAGNDEFADERFTDDESADGKTLDDETADDEAVGDDEGIGNIASHDEIPRRAVSHKPQLIGLVENEQWWRSHPSRAPLDTRAWALQERLLSPRILYLTDEQVFWECLEVGCCETFPDGVPADYISPERRWRHMDENMFQVFELFGGPLESNLSHRQYLRGLVSDSYKISEGVSPNEEVETHWKHIVQAFCRRKLTFNKDKLVALSGIASALQARTGDKYLAGLWQSSLPRSLLWIAYSSTTQEQEKSGPHRAPSWSWASVDANVVRLHSYENRTYPIAEPKQSLVDIVGVDMEYIPGNEMAEPISGVLHLRGYLYTLLSSEEADRGTILRDLPLHEKDGPKMIYKFRVRAKNGNVFQMQERLEVDPPRSGGVNDSDADALFEERVFFLPILQGHMSLSSLILIKRKEDGLFRRIGAAFASATDETVIDRMGVTFDLLARRDDRDQISII